MTLYHEGRSEGQPPMTALQHAQRAMLDRGLYPPYTWVGFTLYGCV